MYFAGWTGLLSILIVAERILAAPPSTKKGKGRDTTAVNRTTAAATTTIAAAVPTTTAVARPPATIDQLRTQLQTLSEMLDILFAAFHCPEMDKELDERRALRKFQRMSRAVGTKIGEQAGTSPAGPSPAGPSPAGTDTTTLDGRASPMRRWATGGPATVVPAPESPDLVMPRTVREIEEFKRNSNLPSAALARIFDEDAKKRVGMMSAAEILRQSRGVDSLTVRNLLNSAQAYAERELKTLKHTAEQALQNSQQRRAAPLRNSARRQQQQPPKRPNIQRTDSSSTIASLRRMASSASMVNQHKVSLVFDNADLLNLNAQVESVMEFSRTLIEANAVEVLGYNPDSNYIACKTVFIFTYFVETCFCVLAGNVSATDSLKLRSTKIFEEAFRIDAYSFFMQLEMLKTKWLKYCFDFEQKAAEFRRFKNDLDDVFNMLLTTLTDVSEEDKAKIVRYADEGIVAIASNEKEISVRQPQSSGEKASPVSRTVDSASSVGSNTDVSKSDDNAERPITHLIDNFLRDLIEEPEMKKKDEQVTARVANIRNAFEERRNQPVMEGTARSSVAQPPTFVDLEQSTTRGKYSLDEENKKATRRGQPLAPNRIVSSAETTRKNKRQQSNMRDDKHATAKKTGYKSSTTTTFDTETGSHYERGDTVSTAGQRDVTRRTSPMRIVRDRSGKASTAQSSSAARHRGLSTMIDSSWDGSVASESRVGIASGNDSANTPTDNSRRSSRSGRQSRRKRTSDKKMTHTEAKHKKNTATTGNKTKTDTTQKLHTFVVGSAETGYVTTHPPNLSQSSGTFTDEDSDSHPLSENSQMYRISLSGDEKNSKTKEDDKCNRKSNKRKESRRDSTYSYTTTSTFDEYVSSISNDGSVMSASEPPKPTQTPAYQSSVRRTSRRAQKLPLARRNRDLKEFKQGGSPSSQSVMSRSDFNQATESSSNNSSSTIKAKRRQTRLPLGSPSPPMPPSSDDSSIIPPAIISSTASERLLLDERNKKFKSSRGEQDRVNSPTDSESVKYAQEVARREMNAQKKLAQERPHRRSDSSRRRPTGGRNRDELYDDSDSFNAYFVGDDEINSTGAGDEVNEKEEKDGSSDEDENYIPYYLHDYVYVPANLRKRTLRQSIGNLPNSIREMWKNHQRDKAEQRAYNRSTHL